MQTRMEKWRIYRNEIINEGLLIDRLTDETNISKQYKTKIDNLDKNILSNLHNDKTIAKLVSTNTYDAKESNDLLHYMELIDEKRINSMNEEIVEWNNKYQTPLLIDYKGNISKKWLNEDPTYVSFSENDKKIQIQKSSWNIFQSDSKNQIKKISELSTIINNSNAIQDIKSIIPYEDKKKSYNKILYIIPSVLSAVVLIAIIVLLVVGISVEVI